MPDAGAGRVTKKKKEKKKDMKSILRSKGDGLTRIILARQLRSSA